MTTNPVTSGADLYAAILQNTYLQANRGSKTPQPASQTSSASTNATARYALSLSLRDAPEQSSLVGSSTQTLVALNNATELQNVASTRQSFLELQQILQESGPATPIVLELNGTSTNPLIKFAAQLYQSVRTNLGSSGGGSVGATFSATA